MAARESNSSPPIRSISRWRLILLPFSLSYSIIISFRNLLYDLGVLKSRSLGRPTIAIGNITTGGTGKTPLAGAIAESVLRAGKKPAILSRGYKSRAERSGDVFHASNESQLDTELVGDEIAMLARKLPGVWFGVGANRIATASALLEQGTADCFVLDDAFQRRDVARDLNIVVVDASNPFGNGFSVPAGILREPLSALRRAELIVVSRCEMMESPLLQQLERRLRRFAGETPIILSSTKRTGLRQLDGSQGDLQPEAAIWAMAGVANPAGFEHTLHLEGFDLRGNSWFPDHHQYEAIDINKVEEKALAAGAVAIVVTDKDAVKLAQESFQRLPCYVLEIGIDFGERADIFWGIIDEVVQC